MRLLVLGGTRFVGRALVDAALVRGHEMTLFHRGRHDPGPADVENVHGDRGGDLAELGDRRWDVAIDTSGYLPPHVRASAGLLADRVEHYTFVSSVSVYRDFEERGMDEGAPVRTPPEPEPEELDMELYGELKVGCERAAEAAMPGRVLVVRPGLVVGPRDYMDRFPYWCRRIARGGEVLAPGEPGRRVQLVDVRDLADWMLDMAEGRRVGTFNATGPAEPLTMAGMLESVRAAAGGDVRFTWIPDDFLLREGVGPWEEMPFWVPDEAQGVLSMDVSRAVGAGLRFRPVRETARDVLAWLPGREGEPEVESGIPAGRESELLRAWNGSR